ncbi:MAG: SAM-dependent methyltransferase [Nitrospirae bacterium]|jgi:SAM-dependent MidA family methyltransferase|nr:SAM-dependent methyltransferase [Nitrospirota bacterium]
MNSLEQKIIEKIKKQGPITFKTFMEMALYEPELGYYASEKTGIGKTGDFYTSQHVHPVFGTMLGKQLEEMWKIMKKPSDFLIIEPGAGEGYMCKDILDYLKKCELSNSFIYIIIEKNPFMKVKQKSLLNDYEDKVRWIYSLEELSDITGCILSNELLDSFPVHMIEMEDELKEIYVGLNNGSLTEIKGNPSSDDLKYYLKEFSISLSGGYRTEINLRIKEWLKTVSKVISEGFIFTIDYGYPVWDYYSEDRNRGTLLCYYKHQVNENPYKNIGGQDITAHINFTSVKKWGEEYDFKTIGFCQQGIFFVSLGIDEVIQEIYENHSEYLFEIAKIKKLILPGTIGETHKVMIQYKGRKNFELRGFSIKNQKDKL